MRDCIGQLEFGERGVDQLRYRTDAFDEFDRRLAISEPTLWERRTRCGGHRRGPSVNRGADRYSPFGETIGPRAHVGGEFIGQCVQLHETRPGHVPMRLLGVERQRDEPGQQTAAPATNRVLKIG